MSAITAPLKRARPSAPGRHERHLRVVEEPVTRHTLVYALAMLLVLGGAIFGAVTLNALAAAAAVEARELDAEVVAAERAYAHLVADVAALEDPARIREVALELGMVPGGPGRHLVVGRNLPADGATTPVEIPGSTADPLKPLLSAER